MSCDDHPGPAPEFVTIGSAAHVVREDGWCEGLGCYVFRDGLGRLITIPVVTDNNGWRPLSHRERRDA